MGERGTQFGYDHSQLIIHTHFATLTWTKFQRSGREHHKFPPTDRLGKSMNLYGRPSLSRKSGLVLC